LVVITMSYGSRTGSLVRSGSLKSTCVDLSIDRGPHDVAACGKRHASPCRVGALERPAQFALAERRRVGGAFNRRLLRQTSFRRVLA